MVWIQHGFLRAAYVCCVLFISICIFVFLFSSFEQKHTSILLCSQRVAHSSIYFVLLFLLEVDHFYCSVCVNCESSDKHWVLVWFNLFIS